MTGITRTVGLAVGLAVAITGMAMASQERPYRLSDQQLNVLVNRIDTRTDAFRANAELAIGRSPTNGLPAEGEFDRSVNDFEQAMDRLRLRVNDVQSSVADVELVLMRASVIDNLMLRYRLDTVVQRDWQDLRLDLDDLARAYGIPWVWGNPTYTTMDPGVNVHHLLTGTYQLETNGSDDPRRAAEVAARAVPADRRQRTYQDLLTRLEAPDLIAIERVNNSVTMASTRGPRVTFEADGRTHLEQWSPGRTMNTRVTLEGERLMVATTGDRASDFTVTFEPMENGRSLQMTRTIDGEDLRQPVTLRTAYRRLSDEARWNVDASAPLANEVAVPAGTHFVALLDNALSTANARVGDLYTMTTRSPAQYEGAVIQGLVSSVNESGRLTGHAGMTLSLQSIRLPNGNSSPFDGVIETVRTPDGEAVTLDREGTVDKDDSQTQKTVERSVIGGALGAIIGAISGGGKGAAIGAVIGAGAGAGTVMIEGRDRLELQRGTEVTIISGDARRQQ